MSFNVLCCVRVFVDVKLKENLGRGLVVTRKRAEIGCEVDNPTYTGRRESLFRSIRWVYSPSLGAFLAAETLANEGS